MLGKEMMGLAYFISDQSKKEAEYCMENAFSTYLVCFYNPPKTVLSVNVPRLLELVFIISKTWNWNSNGLTWASDAVVHAVTCPCNLMQKLGRSGFQNATRCGLWWAEMLKAGDQYKEAASAYFRICGEVLLLCLRTYALYTISNFIIFSGTITRRSHVRASFLLLRVN